MSERDDEPRDAGTAAEGAGDGPASAPASPRAGKKSKPRARDASVSEAAAVPPSSETSSPRPGAAAAPRSAPRVHRARGGAVFAVGTIATFLLMANHGQLHLGPLFGILTTLVATLGLLDFLGLLAASSWSAAELETARPWRATALGPRAVEGLGAEPIFLAPIATVPLALAIFAIGLVAGGVPGLPVTIVAALVPLSLSALRRPALMVFVVCSAIVLPFLGAYGLWDPWETHYGEVAREILARDDWISLWWAQEDWFWSKPIFIFWIEALAMGALGVDFRPDAHPAHPEWAIRLPHFLLTIGALLAIYALVQRSFGKRAGVIAAIVVVTLPHFFMLSHQAITDMPFVATMTMAMCMLGLGIAEKRDREVRRYRLGPIVVSAQHAVIAMFAMACIPQVLLLLTRNVSLVTGGFAWHLDRFMFGSAGNAGNPGNAEAREVAPVFDGIAAQPFAQGLIWLIGFVAIVWMLRRERRAQTLYMFAFYFFCALSFMAKGIPGFALPGMVAMFWLIASRRWDLLLEGSLRVARGVLVIATVGLPWYVAMYIRHGQGFTDRLVVHDHINRLAVGVHGDTGSIEYFFEQLGYGLFPWIALAPLAIAGWVVIERRARARTVASTVAGTETGTETPSAERTAGTAAPEPSTEDRAPAAPAGVAPVDADLAARGMRDLWIGGLIAALGTIATVVGYASAAGGGTYVIFYGAILAGLGQMARGAIRASAATPAAPEPALAAAGAGVVVGGAPGPEDAPGASAASREDALAREEAERAQRKRELLMLVGLWGTSAFVLFSAMTTKFHHYIFPAVPAAGVLVGIAFDRLLGARSDLTRFSWRAALGTVIAVIAPLPAIVGVAGLWGDVRGVVPEGVEPARVRDWVLANRWYPEHTFALIALGAALAAGAWWLLRAAPAKTGGDERASRWAPAAATAGLFAAPALLAMVGRDLSWVTSARPYGYERLIHLFVYNYQRPWPEYLDYRPILTGFAIVAAVAIGVAALPIVRQVALRAFLGVAIAFAVWCLDVYLIDLSPHWGQRELVDRYYEERAGPHEPLIAWQMNWKGENFYSGNAVLTFVDLDNRRLQEWVRQHPGQRVYFLLEHQRLANLRSVLRGATIEEVTDERLDNKFILVSADLAGTPSVPIRQQLE